MDAETLSGVRVNTKSGNLILQRRIFDIPGKGVPVEISLTYNSDHRLISSPFGFGWNLSYNIRYTEDSSSNVTIVWGDGRQDTFTWDGDSYTSPPGIHAALSKDASGKLSLITKRGIKCIFSNAAHRKLTSIEDPNGNALTLNYAANHRLISIVDAGARQYNFTYEANGKLSQIEDANLSRSYTFAYDGDGRLTGITDPLGKTESFSYDSENLLTGITDKMGAATAIAYQTPAWDPETRLPQSIARGGSALTFSFDDATSTTAVTDPNGNAWRYVYGSPIKQIIDPAGNETSFTWDNDKNIVSITDRNGNTTAFTYDGKGNLLTRTDALGNVSTWTYEPNFNAASSFTDAKGSTWTYDYDAKGNRIETTDPLGNSVARTFDSSGQVVSGTDRNGHTTTLAYDAHGNVTTMTDALGNQRHFSYDAGSSLTQIIDANGNSTAISYDALDRVISVTDALGNADHSAYDANGNVVAYTDRRGNQWTRTYDSLNRLTSWSDPVGGVWRFAYDANGNLTQTTDANGNMTARAYDSLDRLTSVTDPLGNADSRTYDANGNLTSYTDREGSTTAHAYDALGRITSITDALGNADHSAYDANGNLLTYTDRRGNQWTRTYDSLNRLTSWSDPLGNTWRSSYDEGGNLVALTDAKGQVTTNAYDAANRLISQSFAASSAMAANPQRWHVGSRTLVNDGDATFTYDANGNLLSAKDGNSDYTFAYDALNRKIQYHDNLLGKSVLYAYGPGGLLISKTGPEGDVVSYAYDAAGRLSTLTEPAGVTSFSYDAAGNRLSTDYPSGVKSSFTYDANNRVASIVHKAPDDTVLTSFTYRRDKLGRIVRSDLENGKYNRFFYDALGRIVEDDEISFFANGAPVWTIENYAYDANGNKTTYTQSGVSGATTWDAANRPSADTGWGAQGTNYTYDANGNRTQMKEVDPSGMTTDYSYDLRGRMVAVHAQAPWIDQTYTYTYDVFNHLIKEDDGAGRIHRIMYGSPDSIAEYDGEGNAAMKYTFMAPAPSWQAAIFVRLAYSQTIHALRLLLSWLPGPPDAGPIELPNTIVVTKWNPSNPTGLDQNFFVHLGDNAHDGYVDDIFGGSRTVTDETGDKVADMAHNSRGEINSFNPDNKWPPASEWVDDFWHGVPGRYNTMWPAGYFMDDLYKYDPWTGERTPRKRLRDPVTGKDFDPHKDRQKLFNWQMAHGLSVIMVLPIPQPPKISRLGQMGIDLWRTHQRWSSFQKWLSSKRAKAGLTTPPDVFALLRRFNALAHMVGAPYRIPVQDLKALVWLESHYFEINPPSNILGFPGAWGSLNMATYGLAYGLLPFDYMELKELVQSFFP